MPVQCPEVLMQNIKITYSINVFLAKDRNTGLIKIYIDFNKMAMDDDERSFMSCESCFFHLVVYARLKFGWGDRPTYFIQLLLSV